MEFGNLWQCIFRLATVINNVISTGEALLPRGLCRKNTLHLGERKLVALLSPGYLCRFVDINHQYPVSLVL